MAVGNWWWWGGGGIDGIGIVVQGVIVHGVIVWGIYRDNTAMHDSISVNKRTLFGNTFIKT